MKNLNYLLIIASFVILSFNQCYGQISTLSNTPVGTPPEYVGWDATATIPLEIRHNHTTTPQAINFFTNNTFRMTLTGANGFLGIGSTITTPSFQL
jgi:hypothetical protein